MADKVITDFHGKPIGILKDDGTVIDWVGKPLGSADKSGTRDFIGNPVSPNNIPEILLKRGN